jgi:Fur family zinc uptake transcriptional regulator
MTVKNALIDDAKKYCDERGLRFTPPREHVLHILLRSENPMGAYDILDRLGQYIDNPKPPTAYRAIDFWREHGFIHKIESLNAYISCCADHKHHDTQFVVCDDCNLVEEIHSHAPTQQVNLPKGFEAKRSFTEIHGVCGKCQDK